MFLFLLFLSSFLCYFEDAKKGRMGKEARLLFLISSSWSLVNSFVRSFVRSIVQSFVQSFVDEGMHVIEGEREGMRSIGGSALQV